MTQPAPLTPQAAPPSHSCACPPPALLPLGSCSASIGAEPMSLLTQSKALRLQNAIQSTKQMLLKTIFI